MRTGSFHHFVLEFQTVYWCELCVIGDVQSILNMFHVDWNVQRYTIHYFFVTSCDGWCTGQGNDVIQEGGQLYFMSIGVFFFIYIVVVGSKTQ
jgi:hypothetical protein